MGQNQIVRKYIVCLHCEGTNPIFLIVDSRGIFTKKIIIKAGDMMKNESNDMNIKELQSIINEVNLIKTTSNLEIKTPDYYKSKIGLYEYNIDFCVWPIN